MTYYFKSWVCIGIAVGIDPVRGDNYSIIALMLSVGFGIASSIYLWKGWFCKRDPPVEDRQVQSDG